MSDRLLVGVLGNRDAGKSCTWNTLFGRTVRRGKYPRKLEIASGECVETFLVSGSFEERREYAGDILKNQNCRIILCSMQYIDEVKETLKYFQEENLYLYIQWLNPGYCDTRKMDDRLNLANHILSMKSVLAVRSGKVNLLPRVQEIREFIYGWAKFRNLIYKC